MIRIESHSGLTMLLVLLTTACTAGMSSVTTPGADRVDAEAPSSVETPSFVETPSSVETLSYGPDDAQVLDLHTPKLTPDKPMPTLVLAHGGLWQSGDKSELSKLCDNVVTASSGTMACATINYRLSQDLGGACEDSKVDAYRDQLVDMASAYAMLQDRADREHLDMTRMYVGGHSAGGHLAHLLNLRWSHFEPACANPKGCSPVAGALGFEGIYDIPAWDAYDASFWSGRFRCATRKAFSSSPIECTDPQLDIHCWQAGSPRHLAKHSAILGITPVGDVLIIHSPGDDWVDIAEATTFGSAMAAAFPTVDVLTSTDGTCATGQHNEPLSQTALANCLVSFVASGGTSL